MPHPQLLGLIKKHRVEDRLWQFRDLIIASRLFSRGQIKVRAQRLEILWEGRWRRSVPLSVPLETANNELTHHFRIKGT